MSVPRLRFKKDDGSEFPEWENNDFINILKSITDFRGRTPKKLGMDWSDTKTEHLALSAINVKMGSIDFNMDPHYGDDKLYDKWMHGNELHKGQVLFTTEAPMGNVAQVPDSKPYILSQRTIAFNPKTDIVSENFLAKLLESPTVQCDLKILATGGTAQGISQKSLSNLMVSIPSSNVEQHKIADFFSTLEQITDKTQAEVDAWEKQKQGMMQKLFSQEIRFKADDGSNYPEWKNLIVKDLFSLIKEINRDEENKNVITNSAEFGLIPQRDFFDKDIAVEGNTNKYTVIKKGDFVYNPRKSKQAPYGPFNCYEYDIDGIVSPLYFGLRPKYPEITFYLKYYFASSAWYSYIYNNGSQGGARHDRVGMTNELLLNIPVVVPCLEEQQKIADCLSAFDAVIDKTKQELEAYKQLKKGLMQQMFV